MTQVPISISSEYEAALSGAAYFPLSGAGYLRIKGADRQGFLQRQTTNDLRLLTPDHGLVSVLTSPTARILDVLTLVDEADATGAITLPGLSKHTFDYLRSRIFFMDKVSVEDASSEYLQLDLFGPDVQPVLKGLGFSQPVEPGQALTGEIAGLPIQAIYTVELGLRLLVSAGQVEPLKAALQKAGVATLSPDAYNLLRVESGRPGAGHELVEDYTPLEAGLESAISESKGCYTGQEVLARQVTYDKVTRHLAGLFLDGEVKPGDPVWFSEEERSAGTITSVANSPRLGHVALAILRRPHHLPGTLLQAGERGEGVKAKVAGLPLENHGDGD